MDSILFQLGQRRAQWNKVRRWLLWIVPASEDAFVGDSLPPGPQLTVGMLVMVPVIAAIIFTGSMVYRPDVLPWWQGVPLIVAAYALGCLGYYWLLRSEIGGYTDSPADPNKKKRTIMDIVSQVMLFLGAVGMVFVGSGNPWGFVIALVQQPFWYYISITNRLWGLLAASFVYTLAWGLGIYNNWDKFF